MIRCDCHIDDSATRIPDCSLNCSDYFLPNFELSKIKSSTADRYLIHNIGNRLRSFR